MFDWNNDMFGFNDPMYGGCDPSSSDPFQSGFPRPQTNFNCNCNCDCDFWNTLGTILLFRFLFRRNRRR